MPALFRRKYRTIVLLVVAAVLFYLLQCFTASRLGHLANKKSNLEAHVRQVVDRENLEAEQLLVNNGDHDRHENAEQRLAKDKEKTLKNVNKFNIERKQQEKNIVDTKKTDREKAKYHVDEHLFHMFGKDKAETPCIESKLVEQLNRTRDDRLIAASVNLFGVLDSEKHLYKADGKNMLRCLTATEICISRQQVNDDFCDCPDSSDEPGTSACPDSKFYCTKQIPGSSSQYITSSKVNDGICDCCDGSDEWFGALVPDFMRIKEGMTLGAVYHAPCSDKCYEILAVQQREETVRKKGRELQKEYLRIASLELTALERQSYGPSGIFFPLSKKCFRLKADGYDYNVCPFEKVTQEVFPHSPVVLGRKATVVVEGQQHVLIMDNGDSSLCPFGRLRKSKIFFLCGLEDRIIRISEPERCEYAFTMSSPAAC